MISAEVILDSISPQGIRLTTMKLRYPKFIHGEFMTHRVFSRNASSSRAIPTSKLLEEVRSDALRAGPVFWGKNQPGMQAVEELAGSDREIVQSQWKTAALNAAFTAETMLYYGAHKQIVNRLLEPFSHINVLVSATEWENFFGLRLDTAAQPEMRALAESMWKAREDSRPEHRAREEWHLPFVRNLDWNERQVLNWPKGVMFNFEALQKDMIKVSVARCARVSYESFETGKHSTVEEDLKLYDRLLGSSPIHASPAEHQAVPDHWDGRMLGAESMKPRRNGWQYPTQHGNFTGWRQYRKMLSGEACAPLPNVGVVFGG